MVVYMQWHRKVLKIGGGGGGNYIKNDQRNSRQKVADMSTRGEGMCPLPHGAQKPLKMYDSWLMKPHGRT